MDQAAFAVLFAADRRLLYIHVYGKVGSSWVAEDIIQDVYLRALPHIGTWEDRGKPVLAWLKTIADNLVKDLWKSYTYRLVVRVEDWSFYEASTDPIDEWHAELEERALKRMVWAGVGALPERMRQIMQLVYLDGLTHEQVAEQLGMTLPAVKSVTFRGRRALTRNLAMTDREVA